MEIIGCYIHRFLLFTHPKGWFPVVLCLLFVGCLTMVYSLTHGSRQRHTGILSSVKTKGTALLQEYGRYNCGLATVYSINFLRKIFFELSYFHSSVQLKYHVSLSAIS